MHLLVLSAFRLSQHDGYAVVILSQCTFWCSVLSDRTAHGARKPADKVSMHLLVLSAFRHTTRPHARSHAAPSQCTFWCSVLSDRASLPWTRKPSWCLNAPFGAQCFPTGHAQWLPTAKTGSQCTFWCSVLSDRDGERLMRLSLESQCTFWCSVLSDRNGAFLRRWIMRLNAPFGAQCFPTRSGRGWPGRCQRLNAPFGAQCFPTVKAGSATITAAQSQCTFWCSVLSDSKYVPFRAPSISCLNAPFGAQCFPTLKSATMTAGRERSQCTFWCSVLSDRLKPNRARLHCCVSMHLLVLSAFRRGSFPSSRTSISVSMHLLVLSAFRPESSSRRRWRSTVSMHLLVLSAFRHKGLFVCAAGRASQCTFWCSVLSDT